MNKSSEARLTKVHPELADRIRRAADVLAGYGIFIEVVQGLRTYAEQNALYAQGRSYDWTARHERLLLACPVSFGLAVDVCPFVKGKPDWNAPSSTWEKIGIAGEVVELEWGGRWKSFVDLPHLQLPGPSVAECHALYLSGGLEAVWAKVNV